MCPRCGSSHLKIKQAKGWERIVLLFTGKRKYHCKNCFYAYRAKDRRKFPREGPAANSAAAALDLNKNQAGK